MPRPLVPRPRGRAAMGALVCALATIAFAPACIEGDVPVGTDYPDKKSLAEMKAVCDAFCDVADRAGCPASGDCDDACLTQFERSTSCESELEILLLCAAPYLVSESRAEVLEGHARCDISRYPLAEPLPDDAQARGSSCARAERGYEACLVGRARPLQELGEHCFTRTDSLVMPMQGAVASAPLWCPVSYPPHDARARVWCPPGTTCDCYVDHEVVGSCDRLLDSDGTVVPSASCCAPIFLEHLERLKP